MKISRFYNLLVILMSMNYSVGFAQATSLIIDNQTPGWLSSKIPYTDQQIVEKLKITGYINGTDWNFLSSLIKHKLTALDLSDANIVEGGDAITSYKHDYYGTVYRYIKADEINNDYFETSNFVDLKWFSTPKSAKLRISLAYVDTLIAYSQDGVIFGYSTIPSGSLSLSKKGSKAIKYFEAGHGVSKISIYCPDKYQGKIVLPKTLQYIKGLKFSTSTGTKVVSYVEDPEIITYEDCKIRCEELWVPKGTKEKYLNTLFKEAKNIYEMAPPEAIIINEHQIKLFSSEKSTLYASITPQNAYYSGLTWKSTDENVISVNQNGIINAVGFGKAQIIVCSEKDENIADTCNVEVYEHTTGVDISETSKKLNIGESFCLAANTLPLEASDNQLVWSSDNKEIAVVDDEGKVTGMKLGSCIITAMATDGGSKAECVVTVVQPANELLMGKHTTSCKVGESEELRATVSPETTTDKSVIWQSRDNSIAEVNSTGVVTGKKAGKVFVVAQAVSNVEAKDSCEVTVIQPVTGISLSENTLTMNEIGGMIQLVPQITPDDASDRSVRWTSSNTSVCVVSENGTVVAVGYGISTIIATTVDGGFPATCVVNVKEVITGIDVTADNSTDEAKIYNVAGNSSKKLSKGINLIRMADGTMKKILVK